MEFLARTDKKEFISQFRTNGLFLAKWMTLAFLIENLMIAYVPAETVDKIAGIDNSMAIPIASFIGIPASYMNGYAAIPLISGLLVYLSSMLPSRWIVDQFQAPLHMGAAELPVQCRLHWGKESITEMWQPEIY